MPIDKLSCGSSTTTEMIETINALIDDSEAGGLAPDLIATHNSDPSAHPELSDFISSEADRAEAAADSAIAEYDGIIEAIDAITADPADAVTQIFVKSPDLYLTTGTATLSVLSSRLPVWLLPNGSSTYLSFSIKLPSHWATATFAFIFCNTTANAGNVVFTGGAYNWAIGDTINSAPAEQSVVAAAPTTALISAQAITSLAVTVDPTKTTSVRVGRLGASGSDTLANTVGLIGIVISKAS